MFNTGSPYNVPAGHSVNLDALRGFYKKKEKEIEAEQEAKQEWAEGNAERKAKVEGGSGFAGTLGRR